ncbi:MAG: hypothetical protein R6V04_12560 [bacterium]
MKKQSIILVLLLSFLVFITACDEFATSVDPLIDQVEDELLSNESEINFVINGVHTEFTDAVEQIQLLSGLLADELIFDERVPNATFPTFRNIDNGEIQYTDNSVDGCFNALGQMRFFADNLIERAEGINFSDTNLRDKTYFYGYFYGGVARLFYAAYFSVDETTPGGVIDAGPFIPQADMYDLAIAKLNQALDYASDYQTKIVNTVLARIYMNQNDYTNAAAYAADGLVEGDEPYQALYVLEDPNWWWTQGGRGRSQVVLDFRFKDYVDEDAEEEARVLLDPIEGSDGTMFYRQGKYLYETSPINFITWQENNLILAECALNGATTAESALSYVNAVRASHEISDLTEVDMDVLMEERDKELMCTGSRLPDQHRWDIWHLEAGKWQYMPIPERERNANPNID